MAITNILTLKPSFGLEESVEFKTKIDESEHGFEARDALVDEGIREYKLRTEFITDTEMDVIWAFYIARQGSYDDFLIKILTEFLVEDEPIGTGDGTTTQFVLHKFPVDTSANHSFQLDDVDTVDYVLSNDTVNEVSYVTFNSAPALGEVITGTYEYYFRMRFKYDNLTRELFNHKLLHAGIELREVRWNTYFPFQGNSSSSSSSSSTGNVVSLWYPIQGAFASGSSGVNFSQDAQIRQWDGSTHLYRNSTIRVQTACAQVTLEMTITRMIVYLNVAPGIGKKRVFTLYHNDLPTNMKLTIADLNIEGDVNVDVACANGDYVYLREDKYNTPGKTHVQIGFAVRTGNPRRCPILGPAFGQAWAVLLDNSNHGAAGVFSSYNGDGLGHHALITTPGILRNMQCRNYQVVGYEADGDDITLYSRIIKKVGSDKFHEEIEVEMTNPLSIRGENTEDFSRIESGDFIAFEGSAANWIVPSMSSINFEPDNPKESNHHLGHMQGGQVDTGESKYCFFHGSDNFHLVSSVFSESFGYWTHEAFTLFAIPGVIKNITVWWRGISIQAGYPITFIIRKNGVDTALTATLTNISQKVTISGQLEVSVRDRISIRTVASAVLPSNQGSSETDFHIGWTFESSNGGEWPIFLTRTII